jgi:hypothetical protein
MPAKDKTPVPEIFQIKVALVGSDPEIWRRLLVPASITLAALHNVLQIAMGWDNSHLYEFRKGKQCYGMPNPDEEFYNVPRTIDDRKVRLDEILLRVGSNFVYTYDMGDSWEHSVVVEKRLPADPDVAYPVCTGGERACPPEDCGGVGGFYRVLEAIQNPEDAEAKELLEWVGEGYDPEAFSVEDVNRALQPRRRKK